MLLQGYRILDLCDERGYLCGKLLADLRTQVIAVESPQGSPARRQRPFYRGDSGSSLSWTAYSAGKKGITINLATGKGRELFRLLVAASDAVVESFPPGYMASLGLDYRSLKQVNPSLVMVSITPFGQSGPYARYKATDLTVNALGGFLYMTGDPDRPPVRISFPQAWLIAGAAAAVGTAMALFHRTRTGQGQHVDVSAQAAVARTLDRAPAFWDIGGQVLERAGPMARPGGGTLRRMLWPCKDGHVSYLMLGGTTGSRSLRALIAWMDEEGFDADYIKDLPWEEMDFTAIPPEVLRRTDETLGRFFSKYTKAQLWQQAKERRLLLYPVSTPSEVFQHVKELSPHLLHQTGEPGTSEPTSYLGPFLTLGPQTNSDRRAPALGEHNEEVYEGLLGIPRGRLRWLKAKGAI